MRSGSLIRNWTQDPCNGRMDFNHWTSISYLRSEATREVGVTMGKWNTVPNPYSKIMMMELGFSDPKSHVFLPLIWAPPTWWRPWAQDPKSSCEPQHCNTRNGAIPPKSQMVAYCVGQLRCKLVLHSKARKQIWAVDCVLWGKGDPWTSGRSRQSASAP